MNDCGLLLSFLLPYPKKVGAFARVFSGSLKDDVAAGIEAVLIVVFGFYLFGSCKDYFFG